MKYSFVAVLSLAASTVHAAQIVGTFTVPQSSIVPGASSSPTQSGASVATGPTPTADAEIASQTWGPDQGPYKDMPYKWMRDQGYKQLSCGYGYKKDSDGKCQKEDWYGQDEGCYETIIINKKPRCPVSWVTKTEEEVVTVTETKQVDTTVQQTATRVDVVTETEDKTLVFTQTKEVPTTRIWVSTEIMNETQTKLRTLTETKMQTQTDVLTRTETRVATETAKVIETEQVTRTRVTNVVVPTTFVSVWLSTRVNDRTRTEVVTNSKTVVEQVTATRTELVTATETEKVAVTRTVVQPTTFVSVWVSTEVKNETETVARTVSSTVVQSVTATTVVKEVATATVTNERAVKETELSDCLTGCKSYWGPRMNQKPYPPSTSY